MRSATTEPARFSRRKNGDTPAGATTQAMGQADPAPRDRVREADKKKGSDSEGKACFSIRCSKPFFVWPAQASQPNAGFRGCSRGAFTLKAAPRTSPPPALNTRVPRIRAHPHNHASRVRVPQSRRTLPCQNPECCGADSCRVPAFQPLPCRPP